MPYYVKVRPRQLICRDTESIVAPHDIFALAGAVVVDGESHGFALPSVPINERQPHTYIETLYEGFSETPQIGVALVGWDIDDNEKWVDNRQEIEDVTKKISEYGKKVPLIGDYVAWLSDNVPKIVDKFVEWDKDDQLLAWSDTIDVSAEAAVPFVQGYHWTEVKFSHSDGVGYSDWDYSLHLLIECMFSTGIGNKPVGEKTLKPFVNTKLSDWTGEWQSGSVQCSITPSEFTLDALDVSVTERVDGVPTDSKTLGVAISKVFLQFGGVHLGGHYVEGIDKGKGGQTVWALPRLTVERLKGHTATVSDLITGLDPNIVAAASKLVGDDGVVAGVGHLEPNLIAEGGELVTPRWVDEAIGKPPQRQQSGSDLLELSNDAVLEIYHVLHGGNDSGLVELRYIRPVVNVAFRPASEIDEFLTLRVV